MGYLDKTNERFALPKNNLKDRFAGTSAMKQFLGIDETLALERYFKVATRLKRELPTSMEMETVPLTELLFWLKIIMSKHKTHREILILICENF